MVRWRRRARPQGTRSPLTRTCGVQDNQGRALSHQRGRIKGPSPASRFVLWLDRLAFWTARRVAKRTLSSATSFKKMIPSNTGTRSSVYFALFYITLRANFSILNTTSMGDVDRRAQLSRRLCSFMWLVSIIPYSYVIAMANSHQLGLPAL